MIQMLDKMTAGGTQPDLQFIKEELITGVTVINNLYCRDHDVVDLKILRERRKANSMLYMLNVMKSDFSLLRAE